MQNLAESRHRWGKFIFCKNPFLLAYFKNSQFSGFNFFQVYFFFIILDIINFTIHATFKIWYATLLILLIMHLFTYTSQMKFPKSVQIIVIFQMSLSLFLSHTHTISLSFSRLLNFSLSISLFLFFANI